MDWPARSLFLPHAGVHKPLKHFPSPDIPMCSFLPPIQNSQVFFHILCYLWSNFKCICHMKRIPKFWINILIQQHFCSFSDFGQYKQKYFGAAHTRNMDTPCMHHLAQHYILVAVNLKLITKLNLEYRQTMSFFIITLCNGQIPLDLLSEVLVSVEFVRQICTCHFADC